MSRENKTVQNQVEKHGQQKKSTQILTNEMEGQVNMAGLPEGTRGTINNSFVQTQITRLGDHRLLTTQRQAIATQIGRVSGNHYLQKLMAQMQVLKPYKSRGNQVNAPHLQKLAQTLPLLQQQKSVDVRDLPMADNAQEEIRKSAREKLPIWADTFANLWYTANSSALSVIAEPEDPDFKKAQGVMAKAAFGLALAGNLAWAASCLVPVANVAANAALSFGGAFVGSGAVGVLAGSSPTNSQPNFKIPVANALAKARDSIAGVGKDKVKDVADECAAGNVTDIEEQKKKLWAKLLTTTYNQVEPIVSASVAKLNAAATSFVSEWQTHKNSKPVEDEAWKRTRERIDRDGYPLSVKMRWLIEPTGPGGPTDFYKFEVFNEEKLKYATETFKPTLKF